MSRVNLGSRSSLSTTVIFTVLFVLLAGTPRSYEGIGVMCYAGGITIANQSGLSFIAELQFLAIC